jgi:peptide/nickel transport system substrate-binding protein
VKNTEYAKLLTIAGLLLMLSSMPLMTVYGQAPHYPGEEETPKYGGTFILGLKADPLSLNPLIGYDSWAPSGVYNSLVNINFSLLPEPELARSWETSADGLTVTFHLVQNATWHDGYPFTSADVKFSILNISYVYHAVGSTVFKVIDTIETPDNYTVKITTKYPFPPLIMYFGEMAGNILPKHLYENTDILNNPYNNAPIGTGPFKFKEWIHGDHLTYEKNENYWLPDRPYLDKVLFRIIPDPTARMLALEKGEIHALQWNDQIDYSEWQRVTSEPDITGYDQLSDVWGGVYTLFFNYRKPLLTDVRVRQAIMYAIDREDLVNRFIYGIGKIGSSNIPSYHWAYNPNVTKYEYNATKANEILNSAGYARGGDGFRFSLDMPCYENYRTGLEIIKDNLKDVGINVNLRFMEYGAVVDEWWGQWDFDVFMEKTTYLPDPRVDGRMVLDAQYISHIPGQNVGGYNNSRVNAIFALAERETNETTLKSLLYELQAITSSEVAYGFLLEYKHPAICRNEFVGYPQDPTQWAMGAMANVWWRQGTAPESLALTDQVADMRNRLSSLETTIGNLQSQLSMVTTIAAVGSVVGIILAVAAIYYIRKIHVK